MDAHARKPPLESTYSSEYRSQNRVTRSPSLPWRSRLGDHVPGCAAVSRLTNSGLNEVFRNLDQSADLVVDAEELVRILLTKPFRTRMGDKERHNGRRASTQDPSTNDR